MLRKGASKRPTVPIRGKTTKKHPSQNQILGRIKNPILRGNGTLGRIKRGGLRKTRTLRQQWPNSGRFSQTLGQSFRNRSNLYDNTQHTTRNASSGRRERSFLRVSSRQGFGYRQMQDA